MELVLRQNKDLKEVFLLENKKLIEYYDITNQETVSEEDIFIGTVKNIFPGLQSAFVDFGDVKNGYINIKDILPKTDEVKEEKQNYDKINIKKAVHIGDNLIVQVKKQSQESKGAKLSTHISLNGKYVILMPQTTFVTISKKIEDEKQRQFLIDETKKLLPKKMGAIIRTKAKDNIESLKKEINELIKLWNDINKKIDIIEQKGMDYLEKNRCIYKSYAVLEKIFIDYDYSQFENIYVSSDKLKDEINKIVGGNVNIEVCNCQDLFEIDKQLEKSTNKKVWLKSGGFIVIEKTEALTAIDVNSGKYVGNRNLEETVFEINKEATFEIARQLRLRDIGGIIIIDYIDMENLKNKEKIIDTLNLAMRKDRTKFQVNGFTSLDLLEMTRKKIGK